MPPELPILCNQCGYELGDPNEEVRHPDEDDPPDDPHFEVQIRDDGEERNQCLESGRLAKPIGPDDDGYAEVFEDAFGQKPPTDNGGDPEPTDEQRSSSGGRGAGGGRHDESIFDFDEEKSQMDILGEVVGNPYYELQDGQIEEIKQWAVDYDGRMPPNVLEDILKNMSGVSKQKAELIRQRYELKLNRWIQNQHNQEAGPPIGMLQGGLNAPSQEDGGGRRSPPPTPTPTASPPDEKPDERQDDDDEDRERRRSVGGGGFTNLSEERRKRRVKRRNDAADIAAEEVAQQVAPEVARELANNFGTYFGLPATILEQKARKDPDWFIEKANEIEEKLDIDILNMLEESQAKQEEQQQKGQKRPQSSVDTELDDALENIDKKDEPEDQESETERITMEETTESEEENESSSGDGRFEEIFNSDSSAMEAQ